MLSSLQLEFISRDTPWSFPVFKTNQKPTFWRCLPSSAGLYCCFLTCLKRYIWSADFSVFANLEVAIVWRPFFHVCIGMTLNIRVRIRWLCLLFSRAPLLQMIGFKLVGSYIGRAQTTLWETPSQPMEVLLPSNIFVVLPDFESCENLMRCLWPNPRH